MSDKKPKKFKPRKEVLLKSGGYIVPSDNAPQKKTEQKKEIPLEIKSPFAINLTGSNKEQKGLLVDDILSNVEDFGRADSINGEDNVINPEVPVYYGMQNMGTKEIPTFPEEATGNTSVNILEDIKSTVEKVKHTIVKGLLKDEAFKQYKEGKIQLPLYEDANNIALEVLAPESSQDIIKEKVAQYLGIEESLPGTNFYSGLMDIPTEIGNIGRIGYNKLFDGNLPLTETSKYRSKDDLMSKGLELGTHTIGNLITLSGVMKGTNAALQFVKNPAIKQTLTNVIGFTAQQQPELVSNWLQGKITTEDYLRETGKSGLMGTLFAANPFTAPEVQSIKGSKLASLMYNSIVPSLGPQYDALTDKEFDSKRYIEDVLLNAGLDILMHGRVIRKVSRDINNLKPEERNPERIKTIVDNAVTSEPVENIKAKTLKEFEEGFRIKRKLENRTWRRKTAEVPETNTNEPGKGDFMNWDDEAMRVELRRLGFRNKDIAKMHKDNKLFLISGGRFGKEWTGRGPEEFKIQNKDELKVGDIIRSDNYKNPKEQLEITDIRNDNMIKVKDEAGNEGLIGINGLKKIVEKPSINSLADEYIKKNKNYISQDEARELFIDEGYDRSNPDPKFTKPAWEVVDKVFEKKIKELKDNNVKGKVMITAGAPGSGKSTMAKKFGSSNQMKLVLDTNISDIGETEKRIEKITEAGLTPEINMAYTKPEKLAERMFRRVSKGGHLVKMDKQANDYVKSIENIKELQEKYPGLKIKVYDNSTGKWNKIGIDEVKLYNYNDVIKILENESGKLRKQNAGYESIFGRYRSGFRGTESGETGLTGSTGRGREIGITGRRGQEKPGGIEGVSETGSGADKESGTESGITADALKTELDTAIKENKPVDLNKYTGAFLKNTFNSDSKNTENRPYDDLYRQAREHNYNLNKKIIGDALNDMSLDFGGLSKLSDISKPKVLKAVYDIAGYHFDKLRRLAKDGAVKFGKWAKAMTDELGGKIRKHLEGLWKEVKGYFTGEKSLTGTGLSMGFPPPKGERPDHTEKIRMDAIGKVAELVNKYSKEIEAEGKIKNDIDLLERVRQKVRKDIHNLEEFRKLTASEKEKVIAAVQKFYKERAREVLNIEENPFIEEYEDKGLAKYHPRYWIRQSKKILQNQGEAGKELAERISKMTDREREMMGIPSVLYLEYKSLSKDEMIEFKRIRNNMMLEEIEPVSVKSEKVKLLNDKFNEYYKSVDKNAEDLSMETFDITTNQKRSYHGRNVYEPRILDERKLNELYPGKKSKGRSGLNRIREINDRAERVFQYLVDTKQAKDRADAIDKLNKLRAIRTQVAKAGNLEFSRIDNVRLPEEYYINDPLDRLVKYATKISRRIAHAEQFGVEGDIASSLLDKIKTEGFNEPFAREVYNYESNIKDPKLAGWEDAINIAKSWNAISKFTPFTTLRNSLQGFLGSATRGNIKAGVTGLVKSFTREAKLNAYESGALADTIESVVMSEFGGGADTKLGRFTRNYLEWIGFSGTDRINRVISASAGEVFYKDMLKRIQNNSLLRRRAYREFEKIGLDPEAVTKRGKFTNDEINMIRRKFAGDAQFNIRPSDLPLYWSSPLGKLVTQWKPFGYKMGQLVLDNVLKEAFIHKNPFPLITALAAYGVAGETVNYIIDSIRSMFGFNPFKDEKDKETAYEKSLINQVSKGNTKRIVKRLLENYGGLGVLSMTVDILRTMGYGKSSYGKVSNVIGAIFGPTASAVTTGITNIIEPPAELIGSDFDYEFRDHVKGIYQTLVSNTPGVGVLRTFGITKAGQDALLNWLFGKPKKKKKKKK